MSSVNYTLVTRGRVCFMHYVSTQGDEAHGIRGLNYARNVTTGVQRSLANMRYLSEVCGVHVGELPQISLYSSIL